MKRFEYKGSLPLHYAASGGNVEMMQFCLRQGEIVTTLNAKNAKGQSAFELAVANDRKAMVEFLLEQSFAIDPCVDKSVVWIAFEHEAIEVLPLLIEKGAVLDTLDNAKFSFLASVLSHCVNEQIWGRTERRAAWNQIAVQLIGKGAPLKMPLTVPTALVACMSIPAISEAFLTSSYTHYDKMKAFVSAALGEADTVESFESDYDVNAVNLKGRTALYYAVLMQDRKAVEFLLRQGALVNLRGEACTSVFYTAMQTHPELALFLLSKGADPNEKFLQRPIIFEALEKDNPQFIKALLEAGADPNAKNSKGESIFFTTLKKVQKFKLLASEYWPVSYQDVLVLLIQKGAHVEEYPKDPLDPMVLKCFLRDESLRQAIWQSKLPCHYRMAWFLAAIWGEVEVLKRLFPLLPQAVFLKDAKGMTALHYAAREKGGEDSRVQTVAFLVEQGAKVKEKTNEGSTPLLLAGSIYSDVRVVRILLAHGADPNTKYLNDNEGLMSSALLCEKFPMMLAFIEYATIEDEWLFQACNIAFQKKNLKNHLAFAFL